MLEKKAYYAFSSAQIFKKLCQNYATFWKLRSLSPKLCYLNFTLILRKIKIISSLTLSILTLMNIHIVHLPVLQSLASQIRMCAPRKAKWLTNDTKINRFWVLNLGQKVKARILVSDAIQAKPSVQYWKTTMHVVNLCVIGSCTETLHKPVNSPREHARAAPAESS